MIISGTQLLEMGRIVQRVIGERALTGPTYPRKIHLFWHPDGYPSLTCWQAFKYEPIRTYDKRQKDWSRMAIAEDIVETVRSAGHELEVQWDE